MRIRPPAFDLYFCSLQPPQPARISDSCLCCSTSGELGYRGTIAIRVILLLGSRPTVAITGFSTKTPLNGSMTVMGILQQQRAPRESGILWTISASEG